MLSIRQQGVISVVKIFIPICIPDIIIVQIKTLKFTKQINTKYCFYGNRSVLHEHFFAIHAAIFSSADYAHIQYRTVEKNLC